MDLDSYVVNQLTFLLLHTAFNYCYSTALITLFKSQEHKKRNRFLIVTHVIKKLGMWFQQYGDIVSRSRDLSRKNNPPKRQTISEKKFGDKSRSEFRGL